MKKAAEILSRLLETREQSAAGQYASVFAAWQEISGVSLAEHSQVYEIRNRNLLVEVDHPGWMQMLLLAKRSILDKVRRRYPQLGIQDLKIRVNLSYAETERPKGSVERPAETGGAGVSPEAKTPVELEQALAGVADQALKTRLRLLLLAILRRKVDGTGRG